MRELMSKLTAEVEIRDVLAFVGLACLAAAAAVFGYELGRVGLAAGGALAVVGAGLFYLGVWHTGRRR